MNHKRSLIVFISIVLGAILFWYSIQLQDIFYETVDVLKEYIRGHELAGMFVFLGLSALSAMFSPFSAAPLIPAAIIIWGKAATFILLGAGWMIGATLAYYAGYSLGHLLLKQFIPFDKIEYYRQRIPRRAQFELVLLFRLSMPAEIPGYTLGLIRYDFWKYFLATAISEVSFAAVTIYASQAFLEQNPAVFIGLVALTIASMSIMFYLFRKHLRRAR